MSAFILTDVRYYWAAFPFRVSRPVGDGPLGAQSHRAERRREQQKSEILARSVTTFQGACLERVLAGFLDAVAAVREIPLSLVVLKMEGWPRRVLSHFRWV